MFENTDINPRILLSVGKVIIAIAWADGAIQEAEIKCLRALLSELPNIPSEYVEALESLLKRPIEPNEREIILDEFAHLVTHHKERNFAFYWLERIINAKGEHNPLEMEIYSAINNRFLKHSLEHIDAPISNDNKVPRTTDERAIANIEIAFNEARKFIPHDLLSDALLRRMLMIGVLATRITLADYRIDETEIEQLKEFIRRQTGLDKKHAFQLACLILVHDIKEDVEVLALCKILKTNSSLEERNHWLDQLLRISQQDGIIVDNEMNQIINIAAALGVCQNHFQRTLHAVMDYTKK